MLQHITDLNINYLSTLDYIDLQNLCHVNQYFNTICFNIKILYFIIFFH
jgi:hypothetical protein